MGRNKLIIAICAAATIIITSFILILIFRWSTINLNEVQGIRITASDENLNLSISEFNDIKSIGRILNKRGIIDSPSCPFGYVKIVIQQKDDDFIIYPATDGCHVFKNGDNKYFHVSNTEWEELMEIFNKYNIDRSLFESGKGI